jgi:hypothetical protein
MSGTRTTLTVVAVAIAAGFALTGCSVGGSPTAVSSTAASSSGGHSSPSVSASSDDAGTDSSDADATLPKTFPKDDVPLIDGKLVYTADLGTGWIVFIKADDFGDAYKDASGKLTDAGFSKSQEVATDQGDVAAFTTDKYQVIVTAGTDATYGKAVSYTVTKQ